MKAIPLPFLDHLSRRATWADAARWRGMRVGLYGGSFNPGHKGHCHVALEALKRLKLDAVWLMVSPGNPLKSDDGMAPFDARLESARELADSHPKLYASDIESRLDSRFTAETIASLQRACPKTDFVWLMGADNMAQFPRWHRFDQIVISLPVAIFDRPGYSQVGFAGRFAQRYRDWRVPPSLLMKRPTGGGAAPRWAFIRQPRQPISATMIRDQLGVDWSGL